MPRSARLRGTVNANAGKGPVTLATIAAHLGVSRSTVSNAYNHPDQLSSELRERILETASDLGYTGPDPVARRLRQRKAGAMGILFSESLQDAFADPASVLFLEGVAQAGEQADSGMFLIPARPSEESAQVVTNAIVDGFILYSIPPGHPFVDAALRRRLPVVCVDQTRIGGVAWVGIDDRSSAREAARHLLDLGHRRFGVLVYGLGAEESSGEASDRTPSSPSVSWLRLEGYADAFKAAGISWAEASVVECERNTEEAGIKAIDDLLSSDDPPTAVLCTSDSLALGVLDGLTAKGLSAPQDMSVVGFNDLPAARAANLTTVRQPLIEKGAKAARLLLEDEANDNGNVLLEAELVIRDTTGKPKSN